MASVSAVVVSWNTRHLLERCLESLYASAGEAVDLEVLVVDNASRDGSPEMVASRFPSARVVSNSRNVGFARAVNQAACQARGQYLLILNPDTELVGPAVPEMVRCASDRPEVAVVGPKLLNPDGTTQSSRRRFPTAATAFIESTVLQRWLPNHAALRRYYVLDRGDDHAQDVDWIVGACLLVRAEAASRVGPMDENYFMYSEELDWCRRFSDAGWKVAYCPSAHVIHHGGQSSDQAPFRRHVSFQHSKCRYFEKYHGRAFAQLLRVFILLNYLFLLAEDAAKLLLLRRNRSMRLRRLSTLAGVVGWQVAWVASMGRLNP